MRKLVGYALVIAWIIYVGITGYVAWRVLAGHMPGFLANYTLGTNAAWVMVGVMLWLATEWARGFDNR